MALIGSIATLRAQAPQTTGFQAAFDYAEEALLNGSPADMRLRSLDPGSSQKIELGGGVLAIEQAYETKARPDGFFESHRKYIDVQLVVEGGELMEVIDAALAGVREGYDPARDLVVYHDVAGANVLTVRPRQAAIFFPVDAHMPSLRVDKVAGLVRKTVIKVPVA